MRTKTIAATVLLASAAALMLAACDGNVRIDASSDRADAGGDYRALARLDCPEREDQLRRTAAATDGMSCEYTAGDAQVTLQLVALDGQSPDARLSALETQLRSLMPVRGAGPAGVVGADADVTMGVEANDEQAHVRLPGLSIDAEGDNAQVRIGGGAVVIDANDSESRVNIVGDGGSTLVNADEEGAEIRVRADEEGDVRRSFKLATDEPGPAGWRIVGYEARGPASGPLVVATLRQRSDEDGDIADAADDLVRKVARR